MHANRHHYGVRRADAGGGTGQLCVGPDNAIWFAEEGTGNIGRCTTTGTITEFNIGPGSSPIDIIAGPDGNIWLDDNGLSQIVRCTPTGTITTFPTPTAGASFTGLIIGADGNLWYADQTNNLIGRVTTAGEITEFTLPTAGANPNGLTLAASGLIWTAENAVNQLASITTAGQITEWPNGSGGLNPQAPQASTNGSVWFTDTANPVFATARRNNTAAAYFPNPAASQTTNLAMFSPVLPPKCPTSCCSASSSTLPLTIFSFALSNQNADLDEENLPGFYFPGTGKYLIEIYLNNPTSDPGAGPLNTIMAWVDTVTNPSSTPAITVNTIDLTQPWGAQAAPGANLEIDAVGGTQLTLGVGLASGTYGAATWNMTLKIIQL